MKKHETHTKTDFLTATLEDYPSVTLVLQPVNRRRRIKAVAFYPEVVTGIAAVISVHRNIRVTGAMNGNFMPVTPAFGAEFFLGPNQPLYGTWIDDETPEVIPRVLSLRIEDQSDEGMFTNVGTGIEDKKEILNLDDQMGPPSMAEDDLGDRTFKEEN